MPGPRVCARRSAVGRNPTEPGHSGRLVLAGAHIVGKLDPAAAEITHSLRMERCRLDDGIDVSEAKLRTLAVHRCQLGHLNAWGAAVLLMPWPTQP